MPRTTNDIEILLAELDRSHERVEGSEGSFLIRAATGTLAVLTVDDPIVTITVTIGPAPKDAAHQLTVYTRLLQINADDLIYGAYGLEGDQIVLSAGLALENLGKNELSAALADIDMALVQHTPEIASAARD